MSADPPWADKKLTKEQRGHMAFRYLDWLLTKNLPNGGFRLLYAILQCLNEVNQFHCFPSIKTLAQRIGRAPQTVWEMLPKLEILGAIEIEWGSQGSGHPNTYRLPAAFLEFYFGPEKGRQAKPDPGPKKHRRAGVSKHRRAGVSEAPKTQVQPPENSGLIPKKHRPACQSHLLATSSHKKERGSAARTSRVERDSASSQRASHEALIEPAAANQQPPSATSIGSGPATDADPTLLEVYARGRAVLGADADAVTARLLAAYDDDAESALDTLAVAAGEADPRKYVESDIEAAARRQRTQQ